MEVRLNGRKAKQLTTILNKRFYSPSWWLGSTKNVGIVLQGVSKALSEPICYNVRVNFPQSVVHQM